MAPKEKAEELVTKFKLILMDEDTDCGNEILCTTIALRCAKVVVDEVKSIQPVSSDLYWESVIHELNNM
jgi:hypothetical protein